MSKSHYNLNDLHFDLFGFQISHELQPSVIPRLRVQSFSHRTGECICKLVLPNFQIPTSELYVRFLFDQSRPNIGVQLIISDHPCEGFISCGALLNFYLPFEIFTLLDFHLGYVYPLDFVSTLSEGEWQFYIVRPLEELSLDSEEVD